MTEVRENSTKIPPGGQENPGIRPVELNLKVGEPMNRDFVERRDDGFYLVGSRVPLDCVVREFREGQSPEAIRSDFPTLSLEQVYGAITFYLGHKDEVDNDMAARERVEDAFSEAHPAPRDLKEKLERARRQSQTS
jgi:uncharacterized protein (DUF433 family)